LKVSQTEEIDEYEEIKRKRTGFIVERNFDKEGLELLRSFVKE